MEVAYPLPPPRMSWVTFLATLPPVEQREFLAALEPSVLEAFTTDWRFNARREQLAPLGDWSIWFPLGGRGSGKTRAGSEWLISQHRFAGKKNTAIVGATATDVRKFCLEGESGILTVAPPDFRPEFKTQQSKLLWPNGTESHLYTAEKPERLRGPNHDGAWCDELASWKYLEETWDMLEMTLRASKDPRVLITTTPKPRKRLREIMSDDATVVSHMTTYDNAANLSEKWLKRMVRRYEGTRLGEQELKAVMLDESEAALWKRAWFDDHRLKELPTDIRRVAVAVDPAASDTEESDETGIIVAGATARQTGVVISDLSGRYTPEGWARRTIRAYFDNSANFIVAERNNGGEMVTHTIKMTAQDMKRAGEIPTADIPIYTVWASQGKFARAEPVSALYEQGRVHHLGTFSALEDQCCVWEPNGGKRSPDRLDALVWCLTKLLVTVPDVVDVPVWGAGKDNYYRGM